MDSELKKMKQKENVMTVILVLLILLMAFIIIFVYTNKKEYGLNPQEDIPVIDENNYINLKDIDSSKYLSIYTSANLYEVSFINVPDVLVSSFLERQEEILNTLNENLDINKEYIENYNKENEIDDYVVKSNLSSIVLFDLKDNILSLLYLIEDEVDYIGLNNHISNIFIDISDNSLVNNDKLLNKYSLTKDNICLEIFNNVVEYHSDKFINKETLEELTKEDILKDKEEYVDLLVDNFDNYVYLYFNQENLYLKYNKNDIANFLFDEELDTIKYSTLKLEI